MKSLFARHGLAVLVLWLMMAPPRAAADTGTTTIISAFSQVVNGPFTLGETGSDNFLMINFGGALTNTTGTIGLGIAADRNLAIVTGPGSSWRNTSNFILGATGSMNQLTITDGGRAGAAWDTILGLHAFSSNNIMLIDGPGSVYDVNQFTLGLNGGSNAVVVANGGRFNGNVSFDVFYRIGSNTLANDNLLQVTGPGSSATTDHLTLGVLGSRNVLEISGGARATNASVVLGRETNSVGNRATLSGANAQWWSGVAIVGRRGGDNSVSVSDGGLFLPTQLTIGEQSAGNRVSINNGAAQVGASIQAGLDTNAAANELFVTGPQSLLTNSSGFVVGSNGSFNRLVLSNAATVLTASTLDDAVSVGAGVTGRSNLLVVAGAGTRFIGSRGLDIGGSGSWNRGVFSGGAYVRTTAGYVGRTCGGALNVGANNLIVVTDPGTVWTNAGPLDVGFCASGNGLVVSNQARVQAGQVRTSVQGGASNSIVVTGVGSVLSCGQGLTVGNASSGPANTLLVLEGARLEGGNDAVGFSGSATRALVAGAGSLWTNRTLTLGGSGSSNRLVLSNAAQVFSGSAVLGGSPSARGSDVFITGTGSAWHVRSNLLVGLSGPHGRLEIQAGGMVSNAQAVLGANAGATNCAVLASGSGSLWRTDAEFAVGALGHGASLVVSNGAHVRSGVGIIDASRFITPPLAECSEFHMGGRALVTGPGSVWECRTNLILGTFGRGNTLDVRDGGLVTSPALILGDASVSLSNFLCVATPGRNVLTVDGGCLAVTNSTGTGVMEIRNGVVSMARGSIVLDELRATNRHYGRFDLLGGSARLRRAYFGTVLPFVIGDGLNAARLTVAESGPGLGWGLLDAPAGVVVQPHGTLAGGAIVSGSVSNAGTLRPGGQDGAYFSIASLSLGPSSALHFDINGRLYTTNYHPISVGAPLSLRGALRVSLRGGFIPAPTDVFHVIGYNQLTNEFDNVAFGGRVTTTDGLGSFLVTFNGFNINLSDYRSTDLDGDGIEDAWAVNHFGHTPLTPAERAADADGDGASNADEFRAGTNPHSAASVLRATLAFSAGRPVVTFPCVAGKDYRVQVSADLAAWQTIEEPDFFHPAPGVCSWMDDGKDTGALSAPTRFYRIEVE